MNYWCRWVSRKWIECLRSTWISDLICLAHGKCIAELHAFVSRIADVCQLCPSTYGAINWMRKRWALPISTQQKIDQTNAVGLAMPFQAQITIHSVRRHRFGPNIFEFHTIWYDNCGAWKQLFIAISIIGPLIVLPALKTHFSLFTEHASPWKFDQNCISCLSLYRAEHLFRTFDALCFERKSTARLISAKVVGYVLCWPRKRSIRSRAADRSGAARSFSRN